jgi:transposase
VPARLGRDRERQVEHGRRVDIATTSIGSADPHKGSHTAVVVDRCEVVVATIRVDADRHQRSRLLEWAHGFESRTWAVEGATGMGAMLAQQVVGAGEQVVDAPAKLSARVRLLERRRIDKTDPNDARLDGDRGLAHAGLERCRLA